MEAVTTTARERWTTILAGQFEYLFANDPAYAMAAKMNTPQAFAEKMTDGLLNGSADKDGKAVKSTCKVLGVKHTYKAIAAFLNS